MKLEYDYKGVHPKGKRSNPESTDEYRLNVYNGVSDHESGSLPVRNRSTNHGIWSENQLSMRSA